MAKQKVFLVDDDSDILVLNRDFLESEQLHVLKRLRRLSSTVFPASFWT